jgi:hypothetical protein
LIKRSVKSDDCSIITQFLLIRTLVGVEHNLSQVIRPIVFELNSSETPALVIFLYAGHFRSKGSSFETPVEVGVSCVTNHVSTSFTVAKFESRPLLVGTPKVLDYLR